MSEVTFKIKPGEKVGFIGPTGAGKSTILRLLTGMDTPQSGTIFIDSQGRIIAGSTGALDQETLRKGIDMILEANNQ